MKLYALSELSASDGQERLRTIHDLNRGDPSSMTIANDPGLLEVLRSSFGYQTDIIFCETDGRIVAYFMHAQVGRRMVSLPHFSYAGFWTAPSHEAAVHEHLSRYLASRAMPYLIRCDIRGASFHYDEKSTYFIRLPGDAQELMGRFKSKLRSQIRRAGSHGIRIESGGVELCDEFFDVYSHNMKRLGSPCLPRDFFGKLLASSTGGARRVYVARLGDATVGAAFVVEYMGFCEVCWASTRHEFNKLSPNMLIYWTLLEDAVARGCRVFSFGRSSRGASTEKFKLQWEPDTVGLTWSSSSPMGGDGRAAHVLTSLWKFVPYRITLPLGALITRYVC